MLPLRKPSRPLRSSETNLFNDPKSKHNFFQNKTEDFFVCFSFLLHLEYFALYTMHSFFFAFIFFHRSIFFYNFILLYVCFTFMLNLKHIELSF
jgi:hypothetical protein